MQEIIVYRNPLEAAIWNSLSSPNIIPIAIGCIVFLCCFLALMVIFDIIADRSDRSWRFRRRYSKLVSYVGLVISVVPALYVTSIFWI